jgi:LacI family transcriptional regulator
MGVLDALHEHGLRCPEDVSITGYDDVPSARDLSPALTTIRVPYEELGALAVRHALDDPHADAGVLAVDLIVRDSVAAPR